MNELLVRVLHEDDAMLVVDKPAGMPVIPLRANDDTSCVWHVLQTQRRERLWVVHRLDRGTSGVLLFARNARSHRALSMMFEAREVHKEYRAFSLGEKLPNAGLVDVALHTARKGKMRPAQDNEPDALESRTEFRVHAARETAMGCASEVVCLPATGRQHQIRVHLRWLRAPLMVDALYANRETLAESALGPGSPALERVSLHAALLDFVHPERGQRVRYEAALPEDLAAMQAWISRSARSE